MPLMRIWRRVGTLLHMTENTSLLQRRLIMDSGHLVSSVPTAGILVIGDEILKGQVRDTNSHFIISRLYKVGVRVMKVSVIGDDVNAISNEVRKFSQQFTYVVTSGGIGPTHDDVTFEGIAKAFGENLTPHPELLKIYSHFYKTAEENAAVLKLASVPESAKLSFRFNSGDVKKSVFPTISVKNVFIFPGVPLFLEKSFSNLCQEVFGGSGSKFYHTDLYLSCDEVSIAEQLNAVVREFPDVNFGSYPQFDESHFCVKLTIEADKIDVITKAMCRLQDVLPQGCIVNYDPSPLTASHSKIMTVSLQQDMLHVRKAFQDILQALSELRDKNQALCVDASLYGIVVSHFIHAAAEKLKIAKEDIPVILLHEGKRTNLSMSMQQHQDVVRRYSLNVLAGPCDLHSAISYLKISCPGLSLLIVGTQCANTALQEPLDFHYGANNVSVLAPVSKWSDSQMLEFIRCLSLNH